MRDRLPTPTRRQREVLACLTRGLMNKQIAAELGISERTVKNHVNALHQRMGTSNRVQLAVAETWTQARRAMRSAFQ